MTATAIMFTGSAFALAADGNQLLGDPPNFIPDASIGETDCAQKIFGAEGWDFEVAYCSLRTEYNTWSSNARNNFSGAIDGRPVLAYSLLKRGSNSRRASSANGT